MATDQTWEDIIRTNFPDLLVMIDTECGLEGQIKKLNLFTKLQLKRIWDVKGDTIQRNKRLLDFLEKGDFKRFQSFCEAMEKSGQRPVVDRHLSEIREVWSSSVNSDDSTSCTPLKESYRDCLRQNWNYLLEKIDDCTDIEAELKKRNSLTKFQLTRLQDFKEDLDKVHYLLRTLENGSQKLFDVFCDILKIANKQYLIDTLTPSEAQRGLDDVKTSFLEVQLQVPSATEREQKLSEIGSESAYAVSNGVVKGRVLVFSNRFFVDLRVRHGTEYDEVYLKDFFKRNLKFKTDVYRDLTAEDMKQTLKDERSKDLKDYDVFILFFLSHGIDGEIYGMDGRTLLTNDIVDLFDGESCPELTGKPKLVFIQACRYVREKKTSVETDGATLVQEVDNLTLKDDIDEEIKANLEKLSIDTVEADAIPSSPYHPKADMAVFSATVKGYPSYRREDKGSFFVRCLLDVFTKKAHTEDVQSMVTEAFRLVHDLQETEQRQLGEQKSHLLRKVYFVI